EHAAVDEGCELGIRAGPVVALEVAREKARAVRPFEALAFQERVHLDDPRRRKGAWKGGGSARGKRKRGCVRKREVAFDLAGGGAPIAEAEDVAMLALADERRVVDLDELLITGEI